MELSRLPGFLLRRGIKALIVILAIVVCNFFLIHAAPGDPASVIAGQSGAADERFLAQLRQQFGLDQPLYVQYLTMMKQIFTGQLTSYSSNQNVAEQIWKGLPVTLSLCIGAALLWMALAVWFGYVLLWPNAGATASGGVPVGGPAPDFELKTVSGEAYRLSDLKGKAVVLNFFATWCRYCEAEMPSFLPEEQRLKKGDILASMGDLTAARATYQEVMEVFERRVSTLPSLPHRPDSAALEPTRAHYHEQVAERIAALDAQIAAQADHGTAPGHARTLTFLRP